MNPGNISIEKSTAQLQQKINRLSRLVELSLLLNSTLDPRQVVQNIIAIGTEILDCEAVSILQYDQQQSALIFLAASGSDTDKLREIPVPLENSLAGTIYRQNRTLIINNVESDPRHFSGVAKHVDFVTHSLVGVPMRIGNQVTGVLEALNKRSGAFNEEDAKVASIIASQAAVAIRNAQMMQALQRAYDELSRQDKLKTQFMAVASHELRTPLGIILGYASFLKEQARGELSTHAEKVLNSAIHLRSLVESMTNMNMLQLGIAELQCHPVAIQQIIRSVIKEIESTAETKGLQLTVELPHKKILVHGDAGKLELALLNILNNAIRFTPQGGSVTIKLTQQKDNLTIIVRDTGIGIDPSDLEHIFMEFYQVEDHLTRRYGGLGLGLSIARGLITLHGGQIWAESNGRGTGTTFKITLPVLKKS